MRGNRSWRDPLLLALTAVASMIVGVACGGSDGTASRSSAAPNGAATATLTGKLTVFAAASLTDSFRSIDEAFTKAHPGVTVEFNFAASSALATQIEQAGPADVFASADEAQMQRLVDKSLIEGEPSVFARNEPVIVVPADNHAGIAAPKDLAKAGVKLVLAAPDVPIGNYARQIIDKLAADPAYGAAFKDAVLRNLVSNEANVRAVLAKIELGEGDAGIVYETDALVSGEQVKTIGLPESANVVATYPVAVVQASDDKTLAAAFIAFLRGAEGQAILEDAGFDAAVQ
ncbi:MAG: molybdate ABC transporter substrate-binding protein [Dehalococcoidia bacterium]